MADMVQTADDVTRTWALVAAGPLEPVGVAFFLKIFEIAPEALRALPAPIQPSHPRLRVACACSTLSHPRLRVACACSTLAKLNGTLTSHAVRRALLLQGRA